MQTEHRPIAKGLSDELNYEKSHFVAFVFVRSVKEGV